MPLTPMNPLANTRSPMGEGLTNLSQMLMQFLSMYAGQKEKDKDRATHEKEFAANQSNEQARLGMESKRVGIEEQSARDSRAKEGLDSVDPFGGAIPPDLAAKLQELVKGTSYEGRLNTKPGLPSTPVMEGLSPDAQKPVGDVTSINPTMAQQGEKTRIDALMQQLKTSQANAPDMARLLSGQMTDVDKNAAEDKRLKESEAFRMKELYTQMTGAKKTSIDDDLKSVASLAQAASRPDIEPAEQEMLSMAIKAMLSHIKEKYPDFKMQDPTMSGDSGDVSKVPPPPNKPSGPGWVSQFLSGAGNMASNVGSSVKGAFSTGGTYVNSKTGARQADCKGAVRYHADQLFCDE